MVKITYNLNNKKDVEFVEDYFWLKYQFKVLNFDVLGNKKLKKYLYLNFKGNKKLKKYLYYKFNEEYFEEDYKTNEEIKEILLAFCRENDLIRVANILNKLSYADYDYIEWLSIFCAFNTDIFERNYKTLLINLFEDE